MFSSTSLIPPHVVTHDAAVVKRVDKLIQTAVGPNWTDVEGGHLHPKSLVRALLIELLRNMFARRDVLWQSCVVCILDTWVTVAIWVAPHGPELFREHGRTELGASMCSVR